MFISPMLLETAQQPFSDPNFIFEPKIDGHRLILSQIDGVTRLYTRHNNNCTRQYPELLTSQFPDDIILDGEIACIDPVSGEIDFESVMRRFQARKEHRIARLSRSLPASYVVFDILNYKGQDMRGLPLMQRKELLANISIPAGLPIVKVPFVEGAGEAVFQQMVNRKMEGMVAKRKNSTYIGRKSNLWQKVINWTYVDDVYIVGYRKDQFGWLAAVPENGRLRPAGIIEFGVNSAHRQELSRRRIIRGEDRNNVYFEPTIRAQVKIRNWTKAGMFRSPVFVDFIL